MKICVFCSSSSRSIERYGPAAEALGREIGRRGHQLVYGGSDMGLMKVVAESARDAGARVIGVIPSFMVREGIAGPGIDQLWKVACMRERKETMERLSDAFVALPGGLGTLEELMEIASHRHMRLAGKPIALVNLRGFFDGLLDHLRRSIEEGFIFEELAEVMSVAKSGPEALDQLEAEACPQKAASRDASNWRPLERTIAAEAAPAAPALEAALPPRRARRSPRA